jgi:acyl-CoA synthetase (NDP forming)
VLSAGFKEAGHPELEEALLNTARENGVRIMGPNIQGFHYVPNHLCAMLLPVEELIGPMAVISQSGSITTVLCEWAVDEGLGISAAVNLGNQADLCESDYLEFFARDDNTKSIVLYSEAVKYGVGFFNTLKDAVMQKPVCIYKAGRTESGARTAASHTGSMTGSYGSFCAACKQYGVTVATDLETLYDQAKALATIDDTGQGRIAVVSSSGGANGIVADEAASLGLNLAQFPPELVEELGSLGLSPLAQLTNPVDLGSVHGEHYQKVAQLIAKHQAADLVLINFADPVLNTFEAIRQLNQEINLPVVVSFMGGGQEGKTSRLKLQAEGIPVYASAARAIRGIQAVAWRTEYLRKRKQQDSDWMQPRPGYQAIKRESAFVLEPEAVKLLADYNIPYPPNALATDPDQARELTESLGCPVVLKVVSEDVSHKSDAGGVMVGLHSPDEAAKGYEQVVERVGRAVPDARIQGVMVCKQAAPGLEVIVGATRDENYGPVVMFGLGGIYTEIHKDVAIRLAPLSEQDAGEMIQEIKGYPILAGARSHEGYDIDGLKKLIVSMSRLIIESHDIQEIDLNPVRVFETGLMALDVRIIK